MRFFLYLCGQIWCIMITIEQLKDVQQRADKLKSYLQIDEKRIQLEEEELHTQAPGFWDDAKAAEAQMRKVKGIKRWIEGYESVRAAVEELNLSVEYYREELVTDEEVDAAYARAFGTQRAMSSYGRVRWFLLLRDHRSGHRYNPDRG